MTVLQYRTCIRVCRHSGVLLAIALLFPPLALGQDPATPVIAASADGISISQPPLPTLEFSNLQSGEQILRISIPCAAGALLPGQGVEAVLGHTAVTTQVRVLTEHAGQPRCARRAMITMSLTTVPGQAGAILLRAVGERPATTGRIELAPDGASATLHFETYSLNLGAEGFVYHQGDRAVHLEPLGLSAPGPVRQIEIVEDGPLYCWLRMHLDGDEGARVIDIRADALGTIALGLQIQRAAKGDGYAPPFGWGVSGLTWESPAGKRPARVRSTDKATDVSFPTLENYARGRVAVDTSGVLAYWRVAEGESVPWQEAAWRSAEVVIGKPNHTPRNSLLEPVSELHLAKKGFAPLYDLGHEEGPTGSWPLLDALGQFTRDGIVQSAAIGDDFGNVTSFGVGQAHGGAFGMNRLNHGPAIFEWSWQSGDRRLRDTAVQWCLNMHDLSIWWGDTETHGGTRYNNAVAAGQKAHEGDKEFMWRTNEASHFCTKGLDAFLYAYEETGDPRFAEALHAQVAYAKTHIHTNTGEARNIGDVKDFLTLYRATGQQEYFDEAMRLFRELREVLSTGDLFSQNCAPLEADPPFIDDDAFGYPHPFAKPYIIGYALAGLPDLLRLAPDEPKLRDVVRAVADFLASSVDPAGGWRYPHPRSSATLMNQGIEHAAQLCEAAEVLEERGEPVDILIDAIETVLQARVQGYARSSAILAGLTGWERSTNAIPQGKSLHDLYAKPADRDTARDYTEGAVGVGGAPPDGLVYFDRVLRFYCARRPADRLFRANPQLQQVLDRIPEQRPDAAKAQADLRAPVLSHGLAKGRPTFSDAVIAGLNFPGAWAKSTLPFAQWRAEARATFLASLQAAPTRVPFNLEVLASEDRGTYEARKIQFNLSADNRVNAYLLVPKAAARASAVLALHDHGAHFSIGKEKVVKPFGVDDATMQDAQDWVDKYYGGRWIGDALALRGHVVLAVDALFWGERGRAEGPEYTAQETIAANLAQLGRSWAGTIVWDDVRAAELLQSLPEVDPTRIGATGLSMGAHRTWALSAATDIVRAGAAICWLGDTPTLLAEGNNQTGGQSAHAMTFPGLRNALDFADVASIACPKPMLYFNGTEDPLFPVPGVEAAYATLHNVYAAQPNAAPLETRLWPVPHLFNLDMQEAAFAWLETQLAR